MQGINQAIAELKRTPTRVMVAEVDGLIVELRCRRQRTADDIFEEIGPWEGESAEQLMVLIHEARVDSEEPPDFDLPAR